MNVINPDIISESIALNRAEFELRVPGELLYLQGHFPAEPVLPGVVQVHWAIELGADRLHFEPRFAGLEVLKFHRIIRPETRVDLALEWIESSRKLKFSYSSAEGIHSQGRVLIQ